MFELKLRCLHADGQEAVRAVLRVPRTDVRQRAEPVDAREGAEVDEHDVAAKACGVSGSLLSHVVAPVEAGQVRLERKVQTVEQHLHPSRGERVDFEHRFDERVGRLLRKVVPDTAGNVAVCVLARELVRVRLGGRMRRAVGIAFEVIVGTAIVGAVARRASRSSYCGSPAPRPIRQR